MVRTNIFNKNYRLHSGKDFIYLRNMEPKCHKSRYVKVYYKSSRINTKNTRVALSISRKVAKSAVRNRLKRVFREFFRNSAFKELGIDTLFVISPKLYDVYGQNQAEKVFLKSVFGLFVMISNKKEIKAENI